MGCFSWVRFCLGTFLFAATGRCEYRSYGQKARMTTVSSMWNALPEHIVVRILQHLSQYDRCMAALTCKNWHASFQSPYLWERFSFSFQIPFHSKLIDCVTTHGDHMQYVSIDLDQAQANNRHNCCQVLNKLGALEQSKLVALSIRFTGENPFFYAGLDLVESLKQVFGGYNKSLYLNQFGLKYVNLSGLPVAYDDSVIDILSENSPNLESLNIQNSNLVCKVSPISVTHLVQRCKYLKYLFIYYCSMCDETLLALAERDRRPIEHLSIICRREQKFILDLSGEAWSSLTANCPNLRVTLGFDHTCPLDKVADIMTPQIPVSVLRLETFTTIYHEVRLATEYYKNTLTKLVLHTIPSIDLSAAILELCSRSLLLQSLLVYCVLDKETVDAILDMKPQMKERGSYILKWEREPEPWIAGYEDDYFTGPLPNIF